MENKIIYFDTCELFFTIIDFEFNEGVYSSNMVDRQFGFKRFSICK